MSLRNLGPADLGRLDTLARLSRMLMDEPTGDLEELLGRVLDVVVEALGAQRGCVVLDSAAVSGGLEGEDLQYSRTVVSEVMASGQSVVSSNAMQDPRFRESRSVQMLGARSVLCVPIRSGGSVRGAIYLDSPWSAGVFGPPDRQLLEILADLSAAAVERAERVRAVLEEAARRRRFFQDALLAVTDGRLWLLSSEEFSAESAGLPRDAVELRSAGDVQEARSRVEASLAGWDADRRVEVATAVSEVATNAVVHGGGGQLRFAASADSVRVLCEDRGPGIAFDMLSRATLQRGFSTRRSLGVGFTVLLQLMDRVGLCTGPEGTRVLLEALRMRPDPAEQLLDGLPERFHWEGGGG